MRGTGLGPGALDQCLPPLSSGPRDLSKRGSLAFESSALSPQGAEVDFPTSSTASLLPFYFQPSGGFECGNTNFDVFDFDRLCGVI